MNRYNLPKTFLRSLLVCVRSGVQALISIAKKTKAHLQALLEGSQNRLRYFLTISVIIFVALSILSVFNPFRLLIPNSVFPIPTQDPRTEVRLYALAHAQGKLIERKQLILITEELFMQLKLLAFAVSNPLYIKGSQKAKFIDLNLEVLPLLGNAIRHVWEPQAGQIVIDTNSNAIEQEIRSFHKNKDPQKKKAYYLDAFFTAFCASIFEIAPQVRSIEFLIDGSKEQLPEMNFDLKKTWDKSSLIYPKKDSQKD